MRMDVEINGRVLTHTHIGRKREREREINSRVKEFFCKMPHSKDEWCEWIAYW